MTAAMVLAGQRSDRVIPAWRATVAGLLAAAALGTSIG